LKDAAQKPVQPARLPFWKDHFVCNGEAEQELAPGNYTYEVDRGPEYFIASGRFSLATNELRSITNRLRRMIEISQEGWWSGELHVHRPLADIELLMRAEDLRLTMPLA